MSGQQLSSAALLALALCSAATPASAADASAPRRLPVIVCDYVGVDAKVLQGAEAVAGEVYLKAGVEIEWVQRDCLSGAPAFYVNLISTGQDVKVKLAQLIVGFAESGGLTATVLYNVVDRLAGRRRVPREVLLGYVIAHELGHLLLPPHSHSATGIMQESVNLDDGKKALRQSFTGDQAQLILRKLDAPDAVVATN